MSLEQTLERIALALEKNNELLAKGASVPGVVLDTAAPATTTAPAATETKKGPGRPRNEPAPANKPTDTAPTVTKDEITTICKDFLGGQTGEELTKRQGVITSCLQRHGTTKMSALPATAYPQAKVDIEAAIAEHLAESGDGGDEDPLG